MQVTSAQVEKLLKANAAFSQLGFSMMLTRLKSRYAKEPSEAMLQTCTKEVNTFLEKYEAIMAADYSAIVKLI